jgi:hypothetical protein
MLAPENAVLRLCEGFETVKVRPEAHEQYGFLACAQAFKGLRTRVQGNFVTWWSENMGAVRARHNVFPCIQKACVLV